MSEVGFAWTYSLALDRLSGLRMDILHTVLVYLLFPKGHDAWWEFNSDRQMGENSICRDHGSVYGDLSWELKST